MDAVMERPVVFRAEGSMLYIYPLTLGKMYIMQDIMAQIGINAEMLRRDMSTEMLRITQEHKSEVCELLSYMTARNDYYSVFDMEGFGKRKELLSSVGDGDIATLLIMVLTANKTEAIMDSLGINDELKLMRKVMRVKEKSDRNSFAFGGLSVFGSLIDTAMERYKLSKRQVVWEMDYTSLRVLLADHINTIYVTDQERRKINIPKDRRKVNGDDREAMMEAIRSQSWD